ncbi:hypothetical protein H5410_029301 [Solanum commersonii]|uniref:Uncharacterized protein n=1 Tax=Solanum commersonii TaxID=4109 RepID=A0A9J5Z4L2_SOLCO|nr:hypothetical protein H5410_029301 [Solanum commersonii]
MAHLQGQTIPGASKPLVFPIFVCYSSRDFMVIGNFDIIFAKILHGPPLRPYYKVKRIPEQLWSQLVTIAKMAHLQRQIIPEEGNPPILPIFVCYSPLDFMLWSQLVTTAKTAQLQGQTIPGAVTQNSDVIISKNLHEPPLKP